MLAQHKWVDMTTVSNIYIPYEMFVNNLYLKLERWQGPPHINKAKQYEGALSFMVSLFIQS